MNIQPGNRSISKKKDAKQAKTSFGHHISTMATVIFFAALIGLVLVIHTNLNQRINDTKRKIHQEEIEKKQLESEIQLKRNIIEELSSWDHISRKIVEYKLCLHPSQPGQTSRVKLNSCARSEYLFASWLRAQKKMPGMTANR